MAAAETLFAGLPGESYSSPQPPLVSPSLQSYQVMHPLPPKSDRLLGCGNPGRRNFGRKPQRTPGRSNDDGRRQVHLDNIRHVAAARFCQLRATLLPRAEPADPIHDELAYRDHRRETDGGARRPDPAADHQHAAALFEVAVGLGRLSRMVSRARSAGADPLHQLCAGARRQTLARDCRRILVSDWYQRLFPTRLSQERQAVPEFETPAQGCRLATSVGGVLTGRGADMITD